MRQLNDFSDERIRETCIPCAEGHNSGKYNRDHIPTKALLNPPYPENLPVVGMCQECNSGYAKDEEYLSAFLGSVICGSVRPDPDRFPVAARILDRSPSLRLRIDQTKRFQGTLWGDPVIQWTPEIERVSRVIVKNARGHVLYEFGQSLLPDPTRIGFSPIPLLSDKQRVHFESGPENILSGWAEVGTRMMQRMAIGDLRPGGWVEVQPSTYRYAVHQLGEQVQVRMVLLEYLAAEVSWHETDIQ